MSVFVNAQGIKTVPTVLSNEVKVAESGHIENVKN